MNEISGGGVNGQVGGYPGARRAIPQARTVRPLMLNSGGRRPSRYFFGGKEVLQAWGVAPRPTCRRSEATLDKEDDNPRDERDTGSFTCREVIDLDSDSDIESPLSRILGAFKREEDDKTDVDFATTSSEAESEPLYDMGDIGSIFSPTDNESKEDITRTMKTFKDEDAMSTTSDGDATCAEDKTSFAFAVPDTQEEPMEDDD